MILINAEQQSALSAEYARKGYAILPQLVSPEVAAEWELKYRSLPGRKVLVGYENQSMWMEQRFSDPTQALDGLVVVDAFVDLITRITGLNAIDRERTEAWINRYSPGEHVPIHCDRAGTTQLVLCLQGLPEPEKGGELMIRNEVVPLRAGDAVLFFACGVPHGIPPVGSSKIGSSGFSRVTCVMRFYAPEGAS
jgi:hypothetical protein